MKKTVRRNMLYQKTRNIRICSKPERTTHMVTTTMTRKTMMMNTMMKMRHKSIKKTFLINKMHLESMFTTQHQGKLLIILLETMDLESSGNLQR